MRISDFLHLHAGARANHPALIFGNRQLTYAELDREVDLQANELQQQGVSAASKVMVSLPNCLEFPITLLALNRLNAVFIPISPRLSDHETQLIHSIARPDFQISSRGERKLSSGLFISWSKDLRYQWDPDLDALCAILFTSGTTGRPKGVMMSDRNLLCNAESVLDYLQLTPEDRTLIFLPLFYSYSLSQWLTTLMAGGTVILMENLLFPMVAFHAIERHGVTGFGGVPVSLNLLASHSHMGKFDSRSLRYILNAGGPIAPALIRRLQNFLPHVQVFNNYGCTEIGPRATAVNCTQHPETIGSIGMAIPRVRLSLIRDGKPVTTGETGEIVLSGPSLMRGYYQDPQATAKSMSPWGFHTGDFAHSDSSGFLYIEGRKDDIFKCGGEKVSTREIEEVLAEHPLIYEAAVVAEPDPVMGAVPVAYVVPRSRETNLSEADIRTFCARRLSRNKLPRRIHHVRELTRTNNGKIQKFRLKEAALQ
jgi:long-chain acyl-CoA synthetase